MDKTSAIILVAALFIIMTGMGLSLTINDFKRVLKYPLAVFIGFLNQIILLPLIAFGICKALGVDGNVAVGIMILSACPGGPTSNLVTHLSKGDTALSVTLTAVNSLVTLVSIPLIVGFSIDSFLGSQTDVQAPFAKIFGVLAVVIIIPLSIGMVTRRYKPAIADKLDKPVRIGSIVVLLIIIVGLIIKERDNIIPYFEMALVPTLLLNVSTMIVGFLTARLFRLNFKQSLTICIESGNQNGTLAIHVAAKGLNSPALAIPAAVYSLMMYVTAIVPGMIGNARAKKEKPDPVV